ncbi:MAG: YceI family protein [Flavobacteriales bacterium]|nr:YceI family protein [Flavobacteriales bacterium]
MKHFLIAATLLATTHIHAQNPKAIDPADSKLLWTASKLTGDHTGRVAVKGGHINVNGKALAGAEVVMDMTGITCMDIEDAGTNAKFVKHLKSEDFFDVDKHPTATFTATKVEPIADAAPGKPNYRITGDLTIKGITKPNTFDCLFWVDGDKARAAAMLSFDRAQYDIKYRSGTFFPEIGDKVIADKVDLTFDVTAR